LPRLLEGIERVEFPAADKPLRPFALEGEMPGGVGEKGGGVHVLSVEAHGEGIPAANQFEPVPVSEGFFGVVGATEAPDVGPGRGSVGGRMTARGGTSEDAEAAGGSLQDGGLDAPGPGTIDRSVGLLDVDEGSAVPGLVGATFPGVLTPPVFQDEVVIREALPSAQGAPSGAGDVEGAVREEAEGRDRVPGDGGTFRMEVNHEAIQVLGGEEIDGLIQPREDGWGEGREGQGQKRDEGWGRGHGKDTPARTDSFPRPWRLVTGGGPQGGRESRRPRSERLPWRGEPDHASALRETPPSEFHWPNLLLPVLIAVVAAITAGAAAPLIGGAIGGFMGLGGAAATSAGLAFLGGGAIAVGGLGMAGGTMVLIGGGALLGAGLGAQMTDWTKGDHALLVQQLAKLEAITRGIFARLPDAAELTDDVRRELRDLRNAARHNGAPPKNLECIERALKRLDG